MRRAGVQDATSSTPFTELSRGEESFLRKVLDIAHVALPPGLVIDGRYQIVRELGRGGMGIVYLARDHTLSRDVALKLHGGAGEAGVVRLRREAAAMAQLIHPHVATVYEFGTYGERAFVVMEYVDGGTARTWLAAAPRTWRAVLAFYLAAGRGLAAAHAAGLVHRDFKPDNVLVGVDGRIRVADFGLASFADGSDIRLAVAPSSSSSIQTDSTAGTPRYMAPEQHQGRPVTAQADQFAFAVSLWEALEHASAAQPATRLPRRLRRILERGRADDPAQRYPGIAALLEQLAPFTRASRRVWIAGAAVLLAGAASAAAYAGFAGAGTGDATCRDAERELAGVWDAPRKARLAARFQALGQATETWREIAQTLDAYAADWVAQSATVCRARASDPEYARRLLCSEGQRAELARVVGEIETRGPERLAAGAIAAQQLVALRKCTDPDRIATSFLRPGVALPRRTDGLVRMALTISGPGTDMVHAALPLDDDVIAAGHASAGIELFGVPIDAPGPRTGFVARVGRSGERRWAHAMAGVIVMDIAAGHRGNVLIAGRVEGGVARPSSEGRRGDVVSAEQQTASLAGVPLPITSGTDCVIASLDAATGALRWWRRCGASKNAVAHGIATDAAGNVYAAGSYEGRARFMGPTEYDAGLAAPFVASWSPDGALRWVTSGKDMTLARTNAIAVSGDAVIAIPHTSGGRIGDRVLSSGSCVALRLDAHSGAVRWLFEERTATTRGCAMSSVAISGDRVAITGAYRSGDHSGWITELALDTGGQRWKRSFQRGLQDVLYGVAYSPAGQLLAMGQFRDENLPAGEGLPRSVRVVRFDPHGTIAASLTLGANHANSQFRRLYTVNDGRILLAGRFSTGLVAEETAFLSAGLADGIVLELAAP